MSELIPETPFSIGWLKDALFGACNCTSELTSWSSARIGIGQGFLSAIVNVKLVWKDAQSLPASVVLKVPSAAGAATTGASESSGFDFFVNDWLPRGHAAECRFYELFGRFADVPAPRAYLTLDMAADQPGAILMQSYVGKVACAEVVAGMRLQQVMAIAEAIATVQARSLQLEASWVDKFATEMERDRPTFVWMRDVAEQQVVAAKPDMFAELYAKVKDDLTPEKAFDLVRSSHERLGTPPVLVQGDMWSSNILFERRADGEASDELVAIVDWQVAHPGNCAEDLARLLACACSSELRRQETTNVLRFYYAKLGEKLGRPPPFSFEAVERSYGAILPFATLFMLFTIPFWTQAKEFEGEDKQRKVEQIFLRGRHLLEDVVAQLPSGV